MVLYNLYMLHIVLRKIISL